MTPEKDELDEFESGDLRVHGAPALHFALVKKEFPGGHCTELRCWYLPKLLLKP
jgi:hypothetical protein